MAEDELACTERALIDGVGAELAHSIYTIEGDPIRYYWRATPDGQLEAYVDNAEDNAEDNCGSDPGWHHFRCEKAGRISDRGACPK